ncbi:MAG: hypothetical protein L6R37_004491 [Teloschistes peruensis]|nr:MAG: hypothetical protein L6R37_004491 [Teloschistes peruensis]
MVEYAAKAVENGGTAIGLRCKDGVVLAVEKLVMSKLLVPGSNSWIQTIDRLVGIAFSGLIPDGRAFISRARDEAASWRRFYQSPIPVSSLADRMGGFAQAYTLYSSVRPFGITAICGGVDEDGKPGLYMIEPSGLYWNTHTLTPPLPPDTANTAFSFLYPPQGYFGAATGKGRQAAKAEIEKLDLANLPIREAVKHAARIIYVAHEDSKDKEFELEMTWISTEETKGRHVEVPKELVEEAGRLAKKALEGEDDEEEEGDAMAE